VRRIRRDDRHRREELDVPVAVASRRASFRNTGTGEVLHSPTTELSLSLTAFLATVRSRKVPLVPLT
jgi:hypothetical protein